MDEVLKKETAMEKIRQEVLNCQKCPLYKTRNKAVIGEGDFNAKIMLIGEAPGYWESVKGVPFCGKAGKVLDELLESVNIKKEEVFIGNLMKCRPVTPSLENRAPNLEEIKACSLYLIRQIEIIRPEIICTLGNYSTAFILEKYGLKDQIEGISKIHGKVFEVKSLFTSLKIIPLYHPAVAVYNPNMKEILKKDFKALKVLLEKKILKQT